MLTRTRFLVVSNMRSGSTWLASTLGTLPDTVTDFEIKWNINYQPHKIHYVLNDDSLSVSQVLDTLSKEFSIVGSKFVFDPIELNQEDYFMLRKKFDDEIRIVHLVRRYRDVFLSARRGFFHQLNEKSPRRIGEHLKAGFDSSRPTGLAQPLEPAQISLLACYNEVRTYLQNDVWALSLSENLPYMQVAYEELDDRIYEVARFIGSIATPDVLMDLVRRPVTLKLPELPPTALISNIGELEPIFEAFEQLRNRLLSPQQSPAVSHVADAASGDM